MRGRKNEPLNEIPTLISEGKVSQPRFITDSKQTPADQKAGDHDRQTNEVHQGAC
ncbi:hypothetical protein [Rhizobium sp. BT-175]|uniref:hypothetical protein n=1 Tax=Rhizobium sp. BT-175 TaxID=2986929 RepID=UPI002236179C|nr:hypothetical protein [Rhizobium sp. BT-175]MCV9943002.1 hypothetical protein [Rhizobium sp. BT-175]